VDKKAMDALAAGSSWHHKWLGISADIGIPAAIFYGFFSLQMLILYALLIVRTRGQGWYYAFSLFQFCFVVRFILLSTTGGHTAESPMEEWWIYGIGLAILYSMLGPQSSVVSSPPARPSSEHFAPSSAVPTYVTYPRHAQDV